MFKLKTCRSNILLKVTKAHDKVILTFLTGVWRTTLNLPILKLRVFMTKSTNWLHTHIITYNHIIRRGWNSAASRWGCDILLELSHSLHPSASFNTLGNSTYSRLTQVQVWRILKNHNLSQNSPANIATTRVMLLYQDTKV